MATGEEGTEAIFARRALIAAALVFIKALYSEDVLGDRINLIEIEADGPPPAGL